MRGCLLCVRNLPCRRARPARLGGLVLAGMQVQLPPDIANPACVDAARDAADRINPAGTPPRSKPSPAARRKVTGSSAETQIWPKYAPGLRLGGRYADAQSVRCGLHRARLAASLHGGHRFRGHRFRGQRFRVCAAAFAMNAAASCSARALAGGGWASAPPSMASYPVRGRP
jgi:hypothetical protein